MLKQFSCEIGGDSGHSLASKKILNEYISGTNLDLEAVIDLPIEKIQTIAKNIFFESIKNNS